MFKDKDFRKDANEIVDKMKEVTGRLYEKDANGNVVVKPGVTKEQLLRALSVAQGLEESFDDIDEELQDLVKDNEQHHKEVANTRSLVEDYKEFLPSWLTKAYGVK